MTIIQDAVDILKSNDRGEFSVPTHGLYPVQFNWDSAFAALGYRQFAPQRAVREVELLLEAQWADGMVPHIIFSGGSRRLFPRSGRVVNRPAHTNQRHHSAPGRRLNTAAFD